MKIENVGNKSVSIAGKMVAVSLATGKAKGKAEGWDSFVLSHSDVWRQLTSDWRYRW